MSRKGFTIGQRRAYDKLKRLGLTDKRVAETWGISPSTLSNTKLRKSRMSTRLETRRTDVRRGETSTDRWTGIKVAVDDTKITLAELQKLATQGGTPRTQKLARKKLDELGKSGLTVEELREGTFERPTFWRTIQGVRVNLLLGRTKGDRIQDVIRKQLAAKGVTFDEGYIDFGGYGGM
jgi:hypothetical protein